MPSDNKSLDVASWVVRLLRRKEVRIGAFGLGMAERVRSVEIRWPSGTVQTLRDVKADQVVRVREPEK